MLQIAPAELLETLREKVHRLEGRRPGKYCTEDSCAVTSGCQALDELLPQGGFQRGTVVEWLAAKRGGGAGTLALIAAREACREEGLLIVLDGRRQFYPPVAAALGIDLHNVIVVQARNAPDELWALDQVLRCPAVGAVWGRVENLDSRAQRRLQLAAESGGTLGLLLRPVKVRGQPTWAAVQLWVDCGLRMGWHAQSAAMGVERWQTRPSLCSGTCHPDVPNPQSCRCLRVHVVRCRGGCEGATVDVVIDEMTGLVRAVSNHETLSLPVAARLAHSAARRSGFPA